MKKKKKLSTRRQAREACFKILYQIEILEETWVQTAESYWLNTPKVSDSVKKFTMELVEGVCGKIGDLDKFIIQKLENWKFERVALVDKIILRMGIFEILYREDIPDSVAINEAIEIAKKYSDSASSKFVNGILDKVSKTKQKYENERSKTPR